MFKPNKDKRGFLQIIVVVAVVAIIAIVLVLVLSAGDDESNPPETGDLPANWGQLTQDQKTDLNPFDCDLQTQRVRADDGRCADKQIGLGAPLSLVDSEDGYEVSCGTYSPLEDPADSEEDDFTWDVCSLSLSFEVTADVDPQTDLSVYSGYLHRDREKSIYAGSHPELPVCLSLDSSFLTFTALAGEEADYTTAGDPFFGHWPLFGDEKCVPTPFAFSGDDRIRRGERYNFTFYLRGGDLTTAGLRDGVSVRIQTGDEVTVLPEVEVFFSTRQIPVQ